jgi:predicted ester cyclase
MARQATRKTMERYLAVLADRGNYASFLAEDATLSMEGTDQHAVGREAVEQTIRFLHERAFDAQPELKSLVVDRGKATVEGYFVGTHIGEFAGVPATGKRVNIPYSVAYDFRRGAIVALRIYMPMDELLRQLGRRN